MVHDIFFIEMKTTKSFLKRKETVNGREPHLLRYLTILSKSEYICAQYAVIIIISVVVRNEWLRTNNLIYVKQTHREYTNECLVFFIRHLNT